MAGAGSPKRGSKIPYLKDEETARLGSAGAAVVVEASYELGNLRPTRATQGNRYLGP